MTKLNLLNVCFALVFLASCSAKDNAANAETVASEDAAASTIGDTTDMQKPDCGATSPRNGSAWIDKMPGDNDNPTLHVVFTFDTSSSGDEYALEFDYAEESNPPAYAYNLVRTTAGVTDDFITVEDFPYAKGSFAEPELRAVIVQCAAFDEPFEITPVEIVY